VRLVGRFAREEDVSWLRQQPGVTVVGDVPSAADELAAARAVVVPIRSGGGTRIKILEAFAHRRPVVSTTIGAEGLEVVDGTHLLIADDVTGFADACVRLLHDDALCQQLVEAGSQLHADHYTGQRARDVIVDVAKRVAAGRRTTSGSAARR
jgi:glycosyltransferase involved in cell wall biosynthesis